MAALDDMGKPGFNAANFTICMETATIFVKLRAGPKRGRGVGLGSDAIMAANMPSRRCVGQGFPADWKIRAARRYSELMVGEGSIVSGCAGTLAGFAHLLLS